MTFIPLRNKNFVKNRIKNTVKVKYKDSDSKTFVYDDNIDSKSIINSEYYQNISNEECNLLSTDPNLNAKKSQINRFYSRIKNPSLKPEKYFQFQKLLVDNGLTNENVKKNNFKNHFKIEKIEQAFLPDSFSLQKLNFVKNKLYKSYREDFSYDFYNNLNNGFCNWNSINFFSQKFTNDRHHSNAIVWPNTKTTSGNQYNFLNDSYSLSFYVNLRKEYNNYEDPECIIHIPDCLNLYIIQSNNTEKKYRIGISLGNKTKVKFKQLTDIVLSNNSAHKNDSGDAYVTRELNIYNNRWYNIGVNVFKKTASSRDIQIYIDGILASSFELDITEENTNPTNSFICLGNKVDYTNISGLSYDQIFYYMFGSKFSNLDVLNSPFVSKDINLGKNNTWNDTGDYNIQDLTDVTFSELLSDNCESFHGEIHDIRIYNQIQSDEKFLEISKKSVQNITNEVNNNNLSFYVPVFYIPSYTKRRSAFNANSDVYSLKYSCLYNPYLANTCGGFESNAENYLIEFINESKPNVIIGGVNTSNVHKETFASSLSNLVDSSDDIDDIKTGVTAKFIYNKNFNDPTPHANKSANLSRNLSYRNLLILPNDNGLQEVDFSIIKTFIDNISLETNKSKFDSSKEYNISTEDIFSDQLYLKSWSLNTNNARFVPDTSADTSKFFTINRSSSNKKFKFTKDRVFNLSNIIFHDNRISNIENLKTNITDQLYLNELDFFNSRIYSVTESNPVTRNYKQDLENTSFNSDNVYLTESILNNNVSYFKFPLPYSVINRNNDCIFTSIFDISSQIYNKKINKRTFSIKDNSLSTTNNNVSLTFKDDETGVLYRSDCLTKVAEWNYVGHLFYKEGIVCINRPELTYFGETDFETEFETDFSMFVNEINIPADIGMFDVSNNKTYNSNLRYDESAFNSEESFVYITDINLHDENLNVVARAKLARPAAKKKSDSILFRLKMDY